MSEFESTTFFIDRCLGNKLIVETLFIAKVYQGGKVKAWKNDLALLAELNDLLNS